MKEQHLKKKKEKEKKVQFQIDEANYNPTMKNMKRKKILHISYRKQIKSRKKRKENSFITKKKYCVYVCI